MASGGINDFEWRETYFVMFPGEKRPTLSSVEESLQALSSRFELSNRGADDQGYFESLTINAPDHNVALEINYETGEAVDEQVAELARQLDKEATPEQLDRLSQSDARFDVMHFERVGVENYDENGEDDLEMIDPSCLLMVVETLVQLTGGLPIDPASGTILP